MKRFIVSVLFVAVFFLGLGALIDRVAAKFKSDEKALNLIRAARTAVGGDNAIGSIQSMKIVGRSTHTFRIDGADKSHTGETEIALQLPDKLMKTVKIGDQSALRSSDKTVEKNVDLLILRDAKDAEIISRDGGNKKIIIKNGDSTLEELSGGDETKKFVIRRGDDKEPLDGEKRHIIVEHEKALAHHNAMRQNELFRLTLGLLLSGPNGDEVNYTYGGETDVDGTACNLVIAESAGTSIKLYLNKTSNLPVMITYTGGTMFRMTKFENKVPAPDSGLKDTVVFRKIDGSEPTAEFQVRFSDYRNTGGVQLPYRWTTTSNNLREVFEVTGYELNPANIADSFKEQKVRVRSKKEGQK